ncbi:hypothetical protein Mp_6g19470 [Marchantia polymorpha subsp. ruderalis]|nr:hypothetical protein MARPO_0045s0116 [Marchantia polymorpha]BBN15423.1 hypothetical protein Mp_6g19470 [Marchantia polymorpha subsp. ruderalis]|eukprot:PTQ39465.1 hypothetical protein MARPO_0045s0116 [Marchantia polymorpha]
MFLTVNRLERDVEGDFGGMLVGVNASALSKHVAKIWAFSLCSSLPVSTSGRSATWQEERVHYEVHHDGQVWAIFRFTLLTVCVSGWGSLDEECRSTVEPFEILVMMVAVSPAMRKLEPSWRQHAATRRSRRMDGSSRNWEI